MSPTLGEISSGQHGRHCLNKYKNIPMSLANACLVRMCEQIADSTICTLDSDFKIYRKEKRKVIPVIIPENR